MAFSLKKTIHDFVRKHNSKFTAEQLYDYVKSQLKEEIPLLDIRIDNLLDECSLVFYNEEKNYYIPRKTYFRGSRFLISPTREEISAGILIPGHRFLPFCNLVNFPAYYTLLQADDSKISTRKIRKKIEELFIYTNLLDLFTLPDYLVYDDPVNTELFRSGDFNKKAASLTVFDLKDFYTLHRFKPGDGLLLEVLDWEKCIYRIAYSSSAERGKQGKIIKKWIQLLDDCFDDLFVEEGLHIGMEEQIARAYYRGGEFILTHPCIHLGGYLSHSELITILPIGERHVLWYIDEPPGPEDFIKLEELSGTVESLDEILKDINCPVSAAEVEAFMRDEFYQRNSSYTNVIEACFGKITLHFFDKYQERICFRYIKQLWAKIKTEYNYFTDQVRGKIRQRGLQLLIGFNSRFREIENQYAVIQQVIRPEDIFEVTRILNSIFSILRLCNEESRLVDEEQDKLEKALFSLETEIQWIIQEIENKLKPELSLVKDVRKPKGAPDKLYILKIALKRLRPPVWRRVRVPGNFTLAELHLIIQTIFAWENEHLHEFRIDDIIYSELLDEQSLDVKDESIVSLITVLDHENQKFQYVYDFGDNWELQIVVEKIIPAKEIPQAEREQVVCLAGRRAGPPEDCGGVWGYENMLGILKDKRHPDYSYLKESFPGDFDADHFDLDEINRWLQD